MARALAICEGGPLDGVVVSTELDPDGKPLPLESRQPVCGVLYVPARPADADAPGFDWGDHTAAFVYEVQGG